MNLKAALVFLSACLVLSAGASYLISCSDGNQYGPADQFPTGSSVSSDINRHGGLYASRVEGYARLLRSNGFEEIVEIEGILRRQRGLIEAKRVSGDLRGAHMEARLYQQNLDSYVESMSKLIPTIELHLEGEKSDNPLNLYRPTIEKKLRSLRSTMHSP